ncbi:MAG: oligosaccharide repeat unit polymerase [Thermoguttaceae bacterium]
MISIFLCLTIPFPTPNFKYVPLLTTLALVQCGLFLYWTRKARGGNYFHPTIFFILSFIIVYFQAPCLKAFGVYTKALEQAPFAQFADYSEHGCVLALMGLSFFFLGYFAFVKHYASIYLKPLKERLRLDSEPTNVYGKASRYAALLSLIPIILYFGFSDGHLFLQGKYSLVVLESKTMFGSFLSLTGTLLVTSAILLQHYHLLQTTSYDWKTLVLRFDRVVLISLTLLIAPLLYAGSRMPTLTIVCLVIAPFFLLQKPLKKSIFVASVIVAGIGLTLVGIGRGGYFSKIPAILVNNTTVERYIPTTELAGSVMTNNTALSLYYEGDQNKQAVIGQYHAWQCLGLIPGLRRVVMLGGFGNEAADRDISIPLTKRMLGENYTWSVASTTLAYTVIDFGPWGIPFFGFLFGFGLRKLEEWALKYGNQYAFAIFAFLCFPCVFANRGTPIPILSRCVQIVICMALTLFVTRKIIAMQRADSHYSMVIRPKIERFLIQPIKERMVRPFVNTMTRMGYAFGHKQYRLSICLGVIFVLCMVTHIVSGGMRSFAKREDSAPVVAAQAIPAPVVAAQAIPALGVAAQAIPAPVVGTKVVAPPRAVIRSESNLAQTRSTLPPRRLFRRR